MIKSKKRTLLIDCIIMPVIPLLFLYNQNMKFLSLSQILIACIVLAIITAALFLLFRSLLHSDTAAFFACLTAVVLLFVLSNVYNRIVLNNARIIFLLPIPIAFIVGYLYTKLFKKKELQQLPLLASVALAVMLLLNILPLISQGTQSETTSQIKYKTTFTRDDATPSPNVYWFLCDGMLGFDAMEQYFGDHQEKLTEELTRRGFGINTSATFEAGHWTRIAIPALMCPDYFDAYLSDVLKSSEKAVGMRERTDLGLDNARAYNETISAFRSKGYTSTVISLNGPYFYPTTDFFYYIDARFQTPKDYVTVPKLVANIQHENEPYDDARLYAYQLGEIFLGGIPGLLYDKLFPSSNLVEKDLETDFSGASDILLGGNYGKINTALVTSLYDSLHSTAIDVPKLVIVHNFLAHFPFDMDESGNVVENSDDIWSYPGQHTYAGKVLINLIDLILEADPDAVIVLQADHGLHMMSSQQITDAFGSEAVVDIWNSVFSAVRIPEKFQRGDEQAIFSNPLNISRYIVNRFVGKNYSYLPDSP